MSETPPLLEIRIHLTNGNVESYVQDDAATVQQILSDIEPQKIFPQPHTIVAGLYSMTAYARSSITMVEFVMDKYPDWSFPLGIDDIEEISQEEFWQRYRPGHDDYFLRDQQRKVGEPYVSFIEIELISGRRVYAQVQMKVIPELDRLDFIKMVLGAPSIYGRRQGGGVTFINIANVARFGFHPGPREVFKIAWPAHHKTE